MCCAVDQIKIGGLENASVSRNGMNVWSENRQRDSWLMPKAREEGGRHVCNQFRIKIFTFSIKFTVQYRKNIYPISFHQRRLVALHLLPEGYYRKIITALNKPWDRHTHVQFSHLVSILILGNKTHVTPGQHYLWYTPTGMPTHLICAILKQKYRFFFLKKR